MGWYTNFEITIQLFDEHKCTLETVKKNLTNENIAQTYFSMTGTNFDIWCGLNNIKMKSIDKKVVLTTNIKRGGFCDLKALVNYSLFVFGVKNVQNIKGTLSGEDGYADMNLGDEERAYEWNYRRRSKSV
jgi:hypothetical protein